MNKKFFIILVQTLVALAWFYAGSDLASATTTTAEPIDRKAIEADWALQDGLYVKGELQPAAVAKPIRELGADGADLLTVYKKLMDKNTTGGDPRLLKLYHVACDRRRSARLGPYTKQLGRIVFTKHYNLGGSHYAYTEGQSDAQRERHFVPGASLCLLEMDGAYGKVTTLVHDAGGVIRDPDVSYDGKRVLFAWKKSLNEDDYHLYELAAATGKIRQLTRGKGVADYEGCYLPDGGILFNSSRCVQIVDCWWTEVSNLYTCDKDGKYLRRLAYDQVHSNLPTVTPDGRVIYTRWDYNDRGQIYPQGLFQMNPDGTAQTECYGNNSYFPTTILHARGIPGSQKIVAVFSGHHSHQRGLLGILDPAKGRQENEGAQLIAPIRETPAARVDAYGQKGAQYQYPYPLDERAFLVTMDPVGSPNRKYPRPYAIYWIDIDGRRELLASDPKISCNQSIPLRARPAPPRHQSTVDYRKTDGMFYLQDVYAGPGLAGVKRGTIKKLRVIEIGYRAAGIGANGNRGPAGGALVSTPISIGNGCWDTKTILGDATVYEDGSACFSVPAHTPVYFQAIDENGHSAQSMRSWSTLQPGETFSCVGCHESKNSPPPAATATIAMNKGPQILQPFHGPARGFSFPKEIQPILDKHCVECHDDRGQRMDLNRPANKPVPDIGKAFSLLGKTTEDRGARRHWSDAYLALTGATPADPAKTNKLSGRSNRLVNWNSVQSAPTMLDPYSGGAAKSGLIDLLESGHGGVKLNRAEMDKIAAWIDLLVPYCGDYAEAGAWSEEDRKKHRRFMEKRRRFEELERRNTEQLIRDRYTP